MVTEIPLARHFDAPILCDVKDLKQEQKRIYFRLPDAEMASFEAICRGHHGSYQNVLEKFARHFMGLDQAGRDSLLRRMADITPAHPASAATATPKAMRKIKGGERG